MPSYLLPSSGAYLLIFLPLKLRITLTGLPALQFRDSAPILSSNGASQFRANALKEIKQSLYTKQSFFLKHITESLAQLKSKLCLTWWLRFYDSFHIIPDNRTMLSPTSREDKSVSDVTPKPGDWFPDSLYGSSESNNICATYNREQLEIHGICLR